MKKAKGFRLKESNLEMLEKIAEYAIMTETEIVENLIMGAYIRLCDGDAADSEVSKKWRKEALIWLGKKPGLSSFNDLIDKKFSVEIRNNKALEGK